MDDRDITSVYNFRDIHLQFISKIPQDSKYSNSSQCTRESVSEADNHCISIRKISSYQLDSRRCALNT